MKPAPTLIDRLYRASFKNEPVMHWKSNTEMREKLMNARRFVLDERMSEFLGILGTEAFVKLKGYGLEEGMAAQSRAIEALRVSAKLPFKTTWIEYDLHKALAASNKLLGRPFEDLHEVPEREGLLLEQHPSMENAFRMHNFSQGDANMVDGCDTWTFPVIYTWTTDDQRSPWPSILHEDSWDSEAATGIFGYHTEAVTIAASDMLPPPQRYRHDAIAGLIREWVGVLRRCWALLATLNDIPVMHREVIQAKGFVARGRYRKFLSYRTITLTVPIEKDLHKVARQIVAAHRKAHDVRGHHRVDWLHRPSVLCEHVWKAVPESSNVVCDVCKGRTDPWRRQARRLGDRAISGRA
jgi:hypothetical protein